MSTDPGPPTPPAEPPGPPRDAPRARALDGLRGLAATAVVFYHAVLHHDLSVIERVLFRPVQDLASLRDVASKIALTFVHGETAVQVFFVLSGCVLSLSLRRRRAGVVRAAAAFAAARILRLYPPLVACLIAFFVLTRIGPAGMPQFTAADLLINCTLWATPMHGPSYTVQMELLAVPFLLAAWLLRRTVGPGGYVFAAFYGLLALQSDPMVLHLPHMHAFLFAFLLGMLASEDLLRPMFRGVPSAAWWALFLLMPLCRMFHERLAVVAIVAQTTAAGLLVAGLLHARGSSLHRMLESPPLQFLGRISYSLYLLNPPVLFLVWAITDRFAWPGRHPLEAGLVIGAASLVLTIPPAWASERWIERPSIRAAHALAAALRGRPAGTPV
jgi:peptidoglycan/LPS O-acetylase OafA/YrhL